MTLDNIKKKYKGRRIGFKATNNDMTCLGFQYTLGEKHAYMDVILPCSSGFHFCEKFEDVYMYYNNIQGDKRFFIVEYGERYIKGDDKSVTDEITFLEEINPLDILNEYFTQKKSNDISIELILERQKLSEEFISQYKDIINWKKVCSYQTLSEDFIRQHKDLVNWTRISGYQKLSEDFIIEFKDLVNWKLISSFVQLSDDFIDKHMEYIDWKFLSTRQTLSEDFIRKYQDFVDWYFICIFQAHLSENFINEFQDKVGWKVDSI